MTTRLLAPRTRLVRVEPDVTPVGLSNVEGTVATFKLPRNLFFKGVTLRGAYTDTLSVAATSVKTYGVPIEKIEVEADGSDVGTLHAARPTDLVREKQVFAGRPLAAMLTPPTVVTITANNGSFNIPLDFALDRVRDGGRFMLPGSSFKQVTVKVYFTNAHANIYTGGTGVVTFSELYLVHETLMDLPAEMRDARRLAAMTSILKRSYEEEVVTAVANTEFALELPLTDDLERIIIQTEDANRDPVATILNGVSLLQDKTLRRLDKVPASTLRAIGSDHQGSTLPTGMHIIDFTQPEDTIDAALPARQFDDLRLILDKAAVAGYIRAHLVKKAA